MPLPRNRLFFRRRRRSPPGGHFVRRLLELLLPCIFGRSTRVAPFTAQPPATVTTVEEEVPSRRRPYHGKPVPNTPCKTAKEYAQNYKDNNGSCPVPIDGKVYEAWAEDIPVSEDSSSSGSDGDDEEGGYECYERTPVKGIVTAHASRPYRRVVSNNGSEAHSQKFTARDFETYFDYRRYGLDEEDVKRIFGVTVNGNRHDATNETAKAMAEIDQVLLGSSSSKYTSDKVSSLQTFCDEEDHYQKGYPAALDMPRPRGRGNPKKFGLTILGIPCTPPEIRRNKDVGHRCSLTDLKEKILGRLRCDHHHSGTACNEGIFYAKVNELFQRMTPTRGSGKSVQTKSSPANESKKNGNKSLFTPSMLYGQRIYSERKTYDDIVIEDVENY